MLCRRHLLSFAFCWILIRAEPTLIASPIEDIDSDDSFNSTSPDAGPAATLNRYWSFAPERPGNQVKWHVDGCSYFWAVSEALENARETIWIQDWWLSPQVYLRRPPAQNEVWRLDRMLQRAGNRGVKIKIVVYKEVTEVFTLDSLYTKKYLEALSPNIEIFRHPDHTSDKRAVWHEFLSALKDMDVKLTTKILVRLPAAGLRALFGGSEQTTFLWAHHEKLCLVDGKIAFFGGLDLSFGRWDTHDHPIADLHEDTEQILFPGQDYNNARVMDFQDVARWQQNKLDRRYTPRMGWSDMSLSMIGPSVEDVKFHFIQRWNWIYKQKYQGRGQPLELDSAVNSRRRKNKSPPTPAEGEPHRGPWKRPPKGPPKEPPTGSPQGPMKCQMLRSASSWSTGIATERSIMAAYMGVIRDSKHFIYIENQFFITSSGDAMRKPVYNRIGQMIVERIIRAHKAREPFHIIVVIPAIPAFAGDLKSDQALSARAIMEFQYYSIIRGGYSIYELLEKAGIEDPSKYIRFYNLRNYDRINTSADRKAPQAWAPRMRGQRFDQRDVKDANITSATSSHRSATGGMDTITRCYMDPKTSLFDIPWDGSPSAELNAFVSEQTYVHTKLLIADDRIVIAGSANINDRSQLGNRDSEIAVIIEDTTPLASRMAGKSYTASKFAASLRRLVMRKHLGLIPVEDYTNPTNNPNFQPVGPGSTNNYDWNSREDKLVVDPLSASFQALWQGRARTNTAAFRKVYRPVPDENVHNWAEYDKFYSRFYPQINPGELRKWFSRAHKDGHAVVLDQPSTWKWGHVVAEEFPGGVRQMKAALDVVRGTLVEMPLHFLIQEDIAKWGLILNPGTEQIYT